MNELKLSVIIPVFQSADILPKLYERLKKSVVKITESYELIFIDDGSPDHSWEVLKKLQKSDTKIKLVQLLNNYGQQKAVLCGFHYASGELIVTIDDDLQQDPEDIVLLYKELLKTNADVVVGRYPKKKHGFMRNLGTQLVKILSQKTIGIPKSLDLTSFRIIKKNIAKEAVKLRIRNPVVGFLLFKISQRFVNIDVNHAPRASGQSNYKFINLLRYFMHMVVDYSDLLLKFVGYSGFLVSFFAMSLGAYYVVMYFMHKIGVSGFATIVLLLCVFFGIMMMSLATIGVYLLRIIDRTDMVPLFLSREEIGFEEKLMVQ